MTEELKDLLGLIPPLILIAVMGYIAVRLVGGWRGVRTPRILGPVLVAPVGLAIMINGQSRTSIYAGAILMLVAMKVAGVWTALRYVQLTRATDRIDPFVTGAPPLPFPADDPACRRDLDTVARLLADPALSFRYAPDFLARIASLQDALPLLRGDTTRD